jgi:hypothetical protein
VFLPGRQAMRIGTRTYNVYLESDPIAPTRGKRILDSGGVLPYYYFIHKGDDGFFTMSIIDMDLNVYYYRQGTKQFYNEPTNSIIYSQTGKIEKLDN